MKLLIIKQFVVITTNKNNKSVDILYALQKFIYNLCSEQCLVLRLEANYFSFK